MIKKISKRYQIIFYQNVLKVYQTANFTITIKISNELNEQNETNVNYLQAKTMSEKLERY